MEVKRYGRSNNNSNCCNYNLIILGLSIRIVNQYERGVVFRLGKVIGIKEPDCE